MKRRGPAGAHAASLRLNRCIAVAIGIALVLMALPVSQRASAAVPNTQVRTSATVTADALPAPQINGVVWTQVMLGNVVFAAGEFTTVRPAGAPAGTDETARSNLLAYDITTGKLITAFKPGAFNGAIKALAVSSDRKSLFVGGDFTRVGTTQRGHFAALDPVTGVLKASSATFNSRVSALAVNAKRVYVGGSFTKANGRTRTRLAAVTPNGGKLTSWRASANASVKALLLTTSSKLLVAGGMFTRLNGKVASGSGAVSPTTGRIKTWKINKVVKNGGTASAILSLATDGTTVYGAGYTYGTGNFEGVYAASSKDGTMRWLQDCHGDVYSVLPIGNTVYSVGHAHYCSNIGGFPDTEPRSAWYRAMAVTKAAAGTVAKNGQTSARTYTNFAGAPAPALLNWFPQLSAGTYTGMSQAAWSVVGNSTYISLGGEFPRVNGTPQQGLVRMAIAAVAPNAVGPTGGDQAFALDATAQADRSVAVSWGQLWDRDDLDLTYRLTRNGEVIHTRSVSVPFWQRSRMTFVDAGVTGGDSSRLEYQVTVTDSSGNTVSSSKFKITLPEVSYTPANKVGAATPTTNARPTATEPVASPSNLPTADVEVTDAQPTVSPTSEPEEKP